MKTVRLTSGLGFYGDNCLPVLAAIEHGDVQYVCSDHLAELTLAILQKDRQKDPAAGYARDLLPMLTQLWPAASARGVKFVLNAGGLNPKAAALALQQLFVAKGWRARVAVVMGDNMLEQLQTLQDSGEPMLHMDSGAAFDTVRTDVVFANVYLGAQPIAKALAMGADIVLTGRVADAALFLGPLIHEFGWAADDWDRLAQGVAVGHLLECSGQGSGGNFGSAGVWQRIPIYRTSGFLSPRSMQTHKSLCVKPPALAGASTFTRYGSNCCMKCTTLVAMSPQTWCWTWANWICTIWAKTGCKYAVPSDIPHRHNSNWWRATATAGWVMRSPGFVGQMPC